MNAGNFTSYGEKLRKKTIKNNESQQKKVNSETPSNSLYQNISTEDALQSQQQVYTINRERVNLESHQLLWLDASMKVNSHDDDLSVTVESLRKIIDYTKLFDNVEECKHFIETTTTTNTFLVISENFGQILIPTIHDLENIITIYVYCHDKETQKQWTSSFQKIKQVYYKLDQLLNDLKQDVEEYLKNEKNALYSKSGIEDQTTVWNSSWPGLVDFLCYVPYPKDYHHKLIDFLKDYYNGNIIELNMIEEFRKDYKSDKAIWWYTRPTFLYRLLNQAMRQQNTGLTFLFGFFIQDLHRQLTEEYEKFTKIHLEKDPVIKVYRGQVMSSKEIGKLQKSYSNYTINNTSFFSTSLDRDISLSFLQSSPTTLSNELEPVLFEIECDVRYKFRPFADISHLSYFPNESEILFSIGTGFFTKNTMFSPKAEYYKAVSYDHNEKIWIIRLKLDSPLTIINNKDFYSDTINVRRILKKCMNIDSFNGQSLSIFDWLFDQLLQLYPSEKWMLAVKHTLVAHHLVRVHNFNDAFSNYGKAIQIWQEYKTDNDLKCYNDIAYIYDFIGGIYRQYLSNTDMSHKYYDTAISYYKSIVEGSITMVGYEKVRLFYLLGECYIGKMHTDISCDNEDGKRENCLIAVNYFELYIDDIRRSDSSTCMEFARDLRYIAFNYAARLDQYDIALKHYDEALEIDMQYFPPRIVMVKNLVKDIIDLCKISPQLILKYKLKMHEYALKYYAVRPTDYVEEIDWKKEEIALSHADIAGTYKTLEQYNLAYENYKIALKLYEETIYHLYYSKNETIEMIKTTITELKPLNS